MSALIVSGLAFITALYSARTSARSLKQSGALVAVRVEAAVDATPGGSGRLKVHVSVNNRGRADVDIYSLKFENWGREFSTFNIPEESRRLKSYSRFDVDLDLTDEFFNSPRTSVWRKIWAIDELTVDLDLGSAKRPIQGLTSGILKNFHAPLRRALQREAKAATIKADPPQSTNGVTGEFTD